MLARGESGVLGGLFAEMQKLPQLIAKCRKHLVLGFADPSGRSSCRTGLHKEFNQEPAKWPCAVYGKAISNPVDDENLYNQSLRSIGFSQCPREYPSVCPANEE